MNRTNENKFQRHDATTNEIREAAEIGLIPGYNLMHVIVVCIPTLPAAAPLVRLPFLLPLPPRTLTTALFARRVNLRPAHR
jgi:hypothetical protein